MEVPKNLKNPRIIFVLFFLAHENLAFSTPGPPSTVRDKVEVDWGRLRGQLDDSRVEKNGGVDKKWSNAIQLGEEVGQRRRRCVESVTVANGRRAACRGDVIFLENFEQVTGDSPDYAVEDNFSLLNSSLWRRDVRIPLAPDYEFCVFHKLGKNVKIGNGTVKIVPTLLDDEFGQDIVHFGNLQLAGCTGSAGECGRTAMAFHILPPVISARLTTRDTFSFRYGRVEIRAKFPRGDWLYPELRLRSANSGFRGEVGLGLARGNDELRTSDADFGSNLLEFHVRNSGAGTPEKISTVSNSGGWSGDFHVYTTTWTEHSIIFEVDGAEVGRKNTSDEFSRSNLYITIGLGVGGTGVFPDGTRSANYAKPWRNVEAKAMLRFWQAKAHWLPSWRLGTQHTAALEVDYVKISAV